MKQFKSIEKLDTAILYTLELASSLSVLLLAFGLIASMANVLTNGAILTKNTIMQDIWSVTQCLAVDASIPGTIIRTTYYFKEKEWVKFWLYVGLSMLLLFTAGIVSSIESVQQTLNLTLEAAYNKAFIPVEALIWIRSISVVLLIVAHSVRDVSMKDEQIVQPEQTRVVPQSSIVSEVEPEQKALPSPDNCERVRAYMVEYPNAKVREVAGALSISISTASKWMRHIVGQ